MIEKDCDLFIQSENIRGEGQWYFVDCKTHRLCPSLRSLPFESAFLGGGARGRAERALAKLESWTPLPSSS